MRYTYIYTYKHKHTHTHTQTHTHTHTHCSQDITVGLHLFARNGSIVLEPYAFENLPARRRREGYYIMIHTPDIIY